MKIGAYELFIIETGDFKLDGGAMFGVVPKPLWSKACPADALNRIEMTARCLLLVSEDRKILVDAGIGSKEEAKFNDIFAVDFSHKTLTQSLAAIGVQPDDITDMVYTHLHFDHAGGSTVRVGNEVRPVFSRARHYVQRAQFDHALSRNERDRASYLDHNYQPVKDAGLLELLDGDVELFPGIEILLSNGHTRALQTIKISDGQTTVWYPTDLIPLAAHIPLPYIMGYDLWPVTTLEDKRNYLSRAAEEHWVILFEHDPHHIACTVKFDDKKRVVKADDVTIN